MLYLELKVWNICYTFKALLLAQWTLWVAVNKSGHTISNNPFFKQKMYKLILYMCTNPEGLESIVIICIELWTIVYSEP